MSQKIITIKAEIEIKALESQTDLLILLVGDIVKRLGFESRLTWKFDNTPDGEGERR